MATQVSLELLIKDAQAAQSVGDIRTKLKELKSEMLRVGESSPEFNKLAVAAGELREKMNEANEAVAAFNPDKLEAVGNFAGKAAAGVSLVSGAMGLFGKQSEETEKALLKVQSAMAFAQGIQGVKGLGKAFTNLFAIIQANPIMAVVAALAAVGLATYKFFQYQKELNSELAVATREYEKQKEATALLSREYNRQIELLTAQGASTEEIIATKRKLIAAQIAEVNSSIQVEQARLREITANKNLTESLLELAGEYGLVKDGQKAAEIEQQNRAKEQKAIVEEQKQQLLDLQNQLKILDEEEKKSNEEKKQGSKDLSDAKKADRNKDRMTHEQYVNAKHEKEQQYHDEQKKLLNEESKAREAARIADLKNHRDYLEAKRKKEYEAYLRQKKQNEQEKKDRQELIRSTIDGMGSLFGSLKELSNKNAKAQKAFAVAEAIVNTYKGVTVALASAPPPANFILAAANLAAGLAAVRNILSTNPESASTGGGSGSIGGGSLQIGSQPNVNTQAQPSTLLNEQSQVINQGTQSQQPIYVSVQEIRRTGRNVQTIEERSVF